MKMKPRSPKAKSKKSAMKSQRAKNNRTLTLNEEEIPALRSKLLTDADLRAAAIPGAETSPKLGGANSGLDDSAKCGGVSADTIKNKIINADLFAALPLLRQYVRRHAVSELVSAPQRLINSLIRRACASPVRAPPSRS